MSRRHTQSLSAAIKTITAFASATFVTRATHGTEPPYVVIHPAQGRNTADRLTSRAASKHPRYTLHVVGEDGDQVQLLMDLLEAKLFPGGKGALTVSGEQVQNFWYESPLPIQVSTDPLPEIVYGVVELGWTAV